MGRAKLNLELISKEKSRNTTFNKRKESLIRKMHEFTTLCDVSACMIIYGPKQENGPIEPELWPQNVDEIHRIIDIYKSKKKDSSNKTFGLNDFFDERKKKIEEDLSKLRKLNMEAKYPSPPPELLDIMNEGQLRAFALALSNKAELVKAKIEVLKRSSNKHQVVMDTNSGLKGQFYPHPHDMHVPYPVYYPFVDHQQQVHSVNHNSMTMLLMDGEDQFGGSSSSNIRGNVASFEQEIFYERSLLLPLPVPVPRYYAPPQLSFSTGWENQDVGYHEMNNYWG